MNQELAENDEINWPITPKSAEEFLVTFGSLRLNGYEIANEHYIRRMNQILDNTASYIELKNELTAFVRERENFAKFLDKRCDENGEYHI